MENTVPIATFDEFYAAGDPPWVIGEPQPAVVELERTGGFRGAVLDLGCGTGEHTILLAGRGYDVLGADSSPNALERARANAARRGVDARFELADALRLPENRRFDVVLDSALFHVFGPADRSAYARSLRAVTEPGSVVHVLALADVAESIGPTVHQDDFAAAFTDGWDVEEVRRVSYRGIASGDNARRLDVADGAVVDSAAHLARIRRR
ncbi:MULTISPECIES: class I SAM-dependent methyltransferase [unclassified Saccharopolyspora]|uniref:class I SAM-dependent methyltransferase n=1 Tax=unclassified Saccharopolyspora TaxID=2646250 RepID=UPI001CD7C080|nr:MULTISPECIES: class I SAM-dependent methyltransferase [unclassified Saccharopolyspora]MCA1187033.1 class I SAM-dependent methyltransferase [Saccharopolyspora sp. 6T]MCA1191900.1 class I SAM-dependent methyltransferase [Saccharopolyspora sp. 6V]MCA1224822.1 class I SAM-dependent methyltransferase [Saccharopolyspora sp. 6M]MCA1280170.1 class I SAM-dependent methyltransferase [Saccharopolyspora sp. 7B]